MNRYPDPLTLQQEARRLRTEALAGMARAAAIKWRTFQRSLHASLSRQVAPPPHP